MTKPDSDCAPTLGATICESDLPLQALRQGPAKALAIITGIEGASYRPLGAIMACDGAGKRFGTLSSGCIERDVALHAAAALHDGQSRQLRYGLGSPFHDLTLPCGGGLDILIQGRPDMAQIDRATAALAQRLPATLTFGQLQLTVLPQLRFLIFGKGPETRALSHLAQAAGYLVQTFSPDAETLQGLPQGQPLTHPHWPAALIPDARTAVALFFHDHDWEPPLLQAALASQAFFVGAQGSRRAHEGRIRALEAMGVDAASIDRLAHPFGLIPSVRDPKTLAVSVLAQVLERARVRA